MNHFSFHRFSLMLHWLLRVNGRRLVFGMAGTTVGVFLGELALRSIDHYADPHHFINTCASLGTMLTLVALVAMACSITSSFNDKRKREAFLMLPSTNGEKFLSLVVLTTVVWPLCLFLSLTLGDTLRMAYYWLLSAPNNTIFVRVDGETYYWWSSTLPVVIHNLTPEGFRELWWPRMLSSIVLLCFMHSWYTFFGTLLRKYAFVVPNLIIIGLAVLQFKVFELFGNDHFWVFRKTWSHGHYVSQYNPPYFWLLVVVLLALTVLCYWASFRIFKNFQLISKKWTNV